MGTLSFKRSTYVITGASERTHVLVATLSSRRYENAFGDSRQEAMLYAFANGIDITNLYIINCRIDEGRTFAAEQAIEAEPAVDWLLFLDDDMLLPHDLLPRLTGNARKYEADILGCLYTSRSKPARAIVLGEDYEHLPMAEARAFHEAQAVVEVGAVGGGCMLIRRTLLQRAGMTRFIMRGGGEDFDYCRRAREAGFRVLCDFGVASSLSGVDYPCLGHIGPYVYSTLDG